MITKEVTSEDLIAIFLGLFVCVIFAGFLISVYLGFYDGLSEKIKDKLKGRF